jgi:DNA-binding CsgD family transcriptional regulator/tetratricopeptide (TPR) repeat protein
MVWGRYELAGRLLAKALNLAERHQYLRYRDQILVSQAHLQWFAGAWEGLAERVKPLADDEEIQQQARLDAALVGGLLHAAVGSHAQATVQFEFVLAERRRRGLMLYTAEPAAALAALWLAEGRIDDALRVTGEPVDVIDRKRAWVWGTNVVPARVSALVAAGRAGEAGDLVGAFARGLRARAAPAPLAAAILCRAMLAEAQGRSSHAAGLYARAAAGWEALPRPYDALLARERQAHSLIAAGEPGRALDLLGGVRRGFADLGAIGDAGRVARMLREHGVQVRQPGAGRPSYGDRLSPRELDVVRLLIRGGTNRDIARQLFLSPNTVTRHVGSAMRKLKVTSRAALAARAMEAGITAADSPSAHWDPVHRS